MKEMKGYSVILSNVGSVSDRYVTGGYGPPYSIKELFERVHQIPQVTGVELIGNWHIKENNLDEIKHYLSEYSLQVSSVLPDHFGEMKWKHGSFAAKDPAIRKLAISHAKEMMDVAAELNCQLINLWPGQDGYDYLFQNDYILERDWLAEGLQEVCGHRADIQVALEYKIKEPRTHSYISTAATSLLIANEVNASNIGVTIDFGHALNAYENPAESVALLKRHGDKLFHVHMNDNYRHWDDDMIVGSVHTIETLEFFYWLKRTNYDGWLSIDQYPYREDGLEAVREGVNMMEKLNNLAHSLNETDIQQLIDHNNAAETTAYLRKLLLPNI